METRGQKWMIVGLICDGVKERTSNALLVGRLDLGDDNLRNKRSKHDHAKNDYEGTSS